MASVSPNWWTCAGIRWTSPPPACTSAGSSRVPQATIRSSETNCGHCGGFSASRSPSHPSYSPRNGEHRSAPLASPAWSNGRAGRPSWSSRRTRTCLGRLRLCLGQQGPRHPRPASLPWPPQHSAYRPIHRAIADAVQGFLAQVSNPLCWADQRPLLRSHTRSILKENSQIIFNISLGFLELIQTISLAVRHGYGSIAAYLLSLRTDLC